MDSGSTEVQLRHIRVRTTTKTLLLTQFPHDLHSLVVSCRCLKISGSFLSVGFQSTAAYFAYLYSVDHYICSYQVLLTYLKLLPVFFSFYFYHFVYRFWVFCLTDFIFLYFSKSCLVQTIVFDNDQLGKKIDCLKNTKYFRKIEITFKCCIPEFQR